MRSVSLSDRSPLGKIAADGLKALGWSLASATQAKADLRLELLKDPLFPVLPQGEWGTIVLLAAAPDRIGISELSLHVQKLAVQAAPAGRVNAVAVAQGWEKDVPAVIDWLAAADMVTGQIILLSGEPGPAIPL
ncbi:MAG TPA: hypothetical protein VJM81_04360 [Rhizorhapis sp.]|nr:hypothetical protein [Rhizorhapis sp.]